MEFYNSIHSKYTGIKGFITLYNYALKYQYMITAKALHKARVLAFWEKHGLEAALDAFKTKKRTLYDWKAKFIKGDRKPEALNEKSKAPKIKRKRLWPEEVIAEIKRLRYAHPNLGKDKIHPLLKKFCQEHNFKYPESSTIGRLIKDSGGLRIFPQKVTHFGKIKPLKRKKVLHKPKDFKAEYPGHLVALDSIEKFVYGIRRYVITFEDVYTRFGFAWATASHASKAAKEFFAYCQKAFPFPFAFVLTDNGSEFKKHFNEELNRLHLIHYHTYPKTPKMNAHIERFNRTIQDEFIDYHLGDLIEPDDFNREVIDYLLWYNTERPHYAFQNKLSPVQYILSLPKNLKINQECKRGWTYTFS
jgi:transposase InsO family protein